MTTRLLPFDEWPRLAGTALETLWPKLDQESRIIVVEDDAGAIVGCWAVLLVVHVEGVWIAPAHRGKGSVARRLLAGIREQADDLGVSSVLTAAVSDDVRQLLGHLDAAKLAGDHYIVPMKRRPATVEGVSLCHSS